MREAAAIVEPAVASDGRRVALVAAAELDYGSERREVFVIDLKSDAVQRFSLDGQYAHDVAWLDDSALAIVRLKSKAFYLLEPGKWTVDTIMVESRTE